MFLRRAMYFRCRPSGLHPQSKQFSWYRNLGCCGRRSTCRANRSAFFVVDEAVAGWNSALQIARWTGRCCGIARLVPRRHCHKPHLAGIVSASPGPTREARHQPSRHGSELQFISVWTDNLTPVSWSDPRSATAAKQEGVGHVVCVRME